MADARFCFPIPAGYDDVHAAPLLCAGLIGHRSLAAVGAAERLGIYGVGAAAAICFPGPCGPARRSGHTGFRERVLMVGDGTHDAPALSSATVGIALAKRRRRDHGGSGGRRHPGRRPDPDR